MNPDQEELIQVGITEDDIHEAFITSALDDAGIHYVVQGYHDEAFDGLFESVKGHSRILVLEDDVTEAEEIVQSIPNPKNEIGDMIEMDEEDE